MAYLKPHLIWLSESVKTVKITELPEPDRLDRILTEFHKILLFEWISKMGKISCTTNLD